MVKSFRIALCQLRQKTSTPRVWLILIMVGCFVLENLRPVLEFSHAVDVPVTPYAFPHLTNDFICQLIIMAGAVMIFCDAPFEGSGTLYVLPRAGRFHWGLGQVLYIFMMSFLYILFLLLLSVLPFLGNLEFGTQWGKIWGTLAKTNAGMQFGLIFSVTEHMISEFQAPAALAGSLALEWACTAWLGLLIYALNKWTLSPAGTITGAFLILLDICISNDWLYGANRFSPITLAQLNTYAGWNIRYGITLTYGICFFVFGIVILSGLCILGNYRDKFSGRRDLRRMRWKKKLS